MLFLKWHIIHLKLVIETNQSSAGAVSEFVQVLRGSSASGQWGNTESVKWHILFIYLSQLADHKVFLLQKRLFLVTEFNYLWLYLELYGFTEAKMLFAYYTAKSKSFGYLFACL